MSRDLTIPLCYTGLMGHSGRDSVCSVKNVYSDFNFQRPFRGRDEEEKKEDGPYICISTPTSSGQHRYSIIRTPVSCTIATLSCSFLLTLYRQGNNDDMIVWKTIPSYYLGRHQFIEIRFVSVLNIWDLGNILFRIRWSVTYSTKSGSRGKLIGWSKVRQETGYER